jgi:hypothetical protein
MVAACLFLYSCCPVSYVWINDEPVALVRRQPGHPVDSIVQWTRNAGWKGDIYVVPDSVLINN